MIPLINFGWLARLHVTNNENLSNIHSEPSSPKAFGDLFDSFIKTASDLFSYSRELGQSVRDWIVEGQQATAEANTELTKVANGCTTEISKAIYLEPAALIAPLSVALIDLSQELRQSLLRNQAGSTALLKWLQQHQGDFLDFDPQQVSVTPEEKQTAIEWMVASKHGLIIQNFYSALPSIAVFNLISLWHRAILAFLGRKPGKRFDIKGGFKKMVEELPKAVLDHVVPFSAPVIEGVRTAIASPMEHSIEAMLAANEQVERPIKLAEFGRRFPGDIAFVRDVIKRSEEANRETFADLEHKGADLVRVLQRFPKLDR